MSEVPDGLQDGQTLIPARVIYKFKNYLKHAEIIQESALRYVPLLTINFIPKLFKSSLTQIL